MIKYLLKLKTVFTIYFKIITKLRNIIFDFYIKTRSILKINYIKWGAIFGLSVFFIVNLALPISVIAQSSNNNFVPSKSQICGGPCPLIDSDFNPSSDSIFRFIIFLARFLTYVGVGLAVLFFVFAGLQFIVGRSKDARVNIITTFIGLVVIIIAYTVVNIIAQSLASDSLGDIINL